MRTLRRFVLVIGLVIGAAALWSWRAHWLPLLQVRPSQPARIEFDNGTVREPRVADPNAPATLPAGQMRKCVGKRETLYSDRDCPPGYAEAKVDGAQRVSVLPSGGAPKPAAGPAGTLPANGGAQTRLHEMLDVAPDPKLRDKMMERATGGN
jgi:hypothetical protein